MFDQKLLFKVMLWSLGLTALLGATAVLTASFETVGRVTATAFLTSASAGFLWQAGIRFEKSPSAIKLAQTGLILFYLCALCGTWSIGDAEKLWVTAFTCLCGLTVAASTLLFQAKDHYRYAARVALVASLISTACWLIGIWTGAGQSKISVTGLAIASWSAGAAVCLVGWGTIPGIHWRWIGVGAAVWGLLLTEYAIAQDVLEKSTGNWLFITGSIVVVVIHTVLCYASPSAPDKLVIRPVAIVATIITTLLIDSLVLWQLDGNQFLLRITIAMAILASTSTLATVFLIQRNRSAALTPIAATCPAAGTMHSPASAFSSVQLRCPRCQLQASIAVGNSACPGCGLRIRLELSDS